MAVCEIYAGKTPAHTSDIDAEVAELALAAEVESAQRAGLIEQAERAKAELELRQKRFGTPLTEEELKVWQKWYPTNYRVSWEYCECGRVHQTQQDLANYRFDRVPQSVLELITRCHEEFRLDWVEIRTPERVPQDPGLFGGKGAATWLFARWSEIGEHLLSFKEVETGLAARRKHENYKGIAWAPTFWGMLIAFACLLASGGDPNTRYWLLKIVATVMTPIFVCWIWLWEHRAKALRKKFAYAF